MMFSLLRRLVFLAVAGALLGGGGLAGCGPIAGLEYDAPPATKSEARLEKIRGPSGGIFGDGGLSIFGGDEEATGFGSPIPVNSLLWRASLDTLSFMPLSSADPFGGVIITDWYTPPESTNERFKMTVYILSRELRADGIRVAVFRQLRDWSGEWVDAEVASGTANELEDVILSRAREMRIAGLGE